MGLILDGELPVGRMRSAFSAWSRAEPAIRALPLTDGPESGPRGLRRTCLQYHTNAIEKSRNVFIVPDHHNWAAFIGYAFLRKKGHMPSHVVSAGKPPS